MKQARKSPWYIPASVLSDISGKGAVMKKVLFLCLVVMMVCVTSGFAAPKGSSALDAHLAQVNNEALANMDTFMTRMNQVYGVTRSIVETMMNTHRFSPSEVYATFWVSQLAKKPPTYVADTYKANRGKGWGVVAKRLGIKPGSAEFHALKRGDGPFRSFDSPGQGKGKGKEKKKKKWED